MCMRASVEPEFTFHRHYALSFIVRTSNKIVRCIASEKKESIHHRYIYECFFFYLCLTRTENERRKVNKMRKKNPIRFLLLILTIFFSLYSACSHWMNKSVQVVKTRSTCCLQSKILDSNSQSVNTLWMLAIHADWKHCSNNSVQSIRIRTFFLFFLLKEIYHFLVNKIITAKIDHLGNVIERHFEHNF